MPFHMIQISAWGCSCSDKCKPLILTKYWEIMRIFLKPNQPFFSKLTIYSSLKYIKDIADRSLTKPVTEDKAKLNHRSRLILENRTLNYFYQTNKIYSQKYFSHVQCTEYMHAATHTVASIKNINFTLINCTVLLICGHSSDTLAVS